MSSQEEPKVKSIFEPLRKPRIENEINTREKNRRRYLIELIASIGLAICLTLIAIYRDDWSELSIKFVADIADIFGTCLLCACWFEFGLSMNKKSRKKNSEK